MHTHLIAPNFCKPPIPKSRFLKMCFRASQGLGKNGLYSSLSLTFNFLPAVIRYGNSFALESDSASEEAESEKEDDNSGSEESGADDNESDDDTPLVGKIIYIYCIYVCTYHTTSPLTIRSFRIFISF